MTEVKARGYTLARKLGCDGSNPYLGVAPDGIPVFVRLSAAVISGARHAEAVLQFLDRYRQLDQRTLIKVRDYWIEGSETRYLGLVTELAGGGSLRDRLRQRGRVAGGELISLFTPLAEAIDFLHRQGIRHGDITPNNLLLAEGLPRLDVPRLPPSGELGASITPLYTAPEEWRGKESPQSDQYSLAACYTELRLGHPPFPGRSTDLPAIMKAHLEKESHFEPLPKAEQEVLRKALAKDPRERYPTCAAFIEALGQAASGEVSRAGSAAEPCLSAYVGVPAMLLYDREDRYKLAIYSPLLLGLERGECGIGHCSTSKSTGWLLPGRSGWSVEYDCPEHGLYGVWSGKYAPLIEQVLRGQRPGEGAVERPGSGAVPAEGTLDQDKAAYPAGDDMRQELLNVLRQAQALLALPGNDYAWSSWKDAAAALAELDRQIAAIENGRLPSQPDLAVLFAPTGPIQEVSLSSGWGHEFRALAASFDAAAARVYAEPGSAPDRGGS